MRVSEQMDGPRYRFRDDTSGTRLREDRGSIARGLFMFNDMETFFESMMESLCSSVSLERVLGEVKCGSPAEHELKTRLRVYGYDSSLYEDRGLSL